MIMSFFMVTLWALLIIVAASVAPKTYSLLLGAFVGAFGAYCAYLAGWTP